MAFPLPTRGVTVLHGVRSELIPVLNYIRCRAIQEAQTASQLSDVVCVVGMHSRGYEQRLQQLLDRLLSMEADLRPSLIVRGT